eukprot:Skav204055  [mRNA]  locus=scaffold3:384164:385960:- [translate_table: standard]
MEGPAQPAEPQILTVEAAKKVLLREDVARFYSLINTREEIRRRREAGHHSRHVYDGLTDPRGEFAEYLRRYRSTNVHRWHDATTKGLHRFCAAGRRVELAADKDLVKRQIVLNFAVWRLIGGTVAFAGEVGFFTNWTEKEKGIVRKAFEETFKYKRIKTLLSTAYKWPRSMRFALTPRSADEDALRMVLYNQGPRAMKGIKVYEVTLVGKFKVLDQLWQVAEEVVEAALPDESGHTSMEKVGNVLKDLTFFGLGEGDQREPSFFCKELIQDLMDTPVFPGGRLQVSDRFTYCPLGPGSKRGLQIVFRRKEIHPSEALPMMQALLSFADEFYSAGDGDVLELHDVQFQLCEYQKKFNVISHRLNSLVDDDLGGPMQHWTTDFVVGRLQEMFQLQGRDLQEVTDDSRSVRRLAKDLCTWLGVSFREKSSEHLIHGDLVVLQDAESRSYLSLAENGTFVECQECDAATFVVMTDEEAPGTIQFDQPQYLETLACRQLAWWDRRSCFAARKDQRGAQRRFDLNHRLCFSPVEGPSAGPASQAVPFDEPVLLKKFPGHVTCNQRQSILLQRPVAVVQRERHMMALLQNAMTQLNRVKRRRKKG